MGIILILFFIACAGILFVIYWIAYWIAMPFINKTQIRRLETDLKALKTKLYDLEKCVEGLTKQDAFARQSETSSMHSEQSAAAVHEPDKQTEPAQTNEAPPSAESKKDEQDIFYKPHTSKESALMPALKKFFSIESVISKLGIILVLIGIGFIFKLGYDNGYIKKEVSLFLGTVAGAALTFFGFKTERKSRIVLSRVLFGGGIAAFYITAYAAYLRYGILGNFSAFVFLSLITVFSYVLSVMTTAASVSIIGLLGSLIIPFVVGLGFLGLNGFGLYVLAVSVLSAAVYFFKRWRTVQFVSIVSFYTILSWLLSISTLTIEDSILFLGLVLALWLIHTVPDLYYYLKESEVSDTLFGKSYSAFAAIVNFCFSLFLFYKLSAYKPLPQISPYLLFVFFYTVLAYLCLRKNKLKNLGLAYIAAGLISIYITIVDSLSFNIRPAAILSVALFLYWLWRKRNEAALSVFTHIAAAVGYISALIGLIDDYNAFSAGRFLLQILFYLAPMIPCVFLQKEKSKKTVQGLVFQLYIFAAMAMLVCKIIASNKTAASLIDNTLAWQILLVFLFAVYGFVHYKTKGAWFYEKTLYLCPALSVLFSLVQLNKLAVFLYPRTSALISVSITVQLAAAAAVLSFSFFKEKNETDKFVHRLAFLILILKTVLAEVSYKLNDFRYGLLLAGLIVLIIEIFYKTDSKKNNTALKVFKIFMLLFSLIYYAGVYPGLAAGVHSVKVFFKIDFISLAVNIGNALIFIKFFKMFKCKTIIYFIVITAVFVFLSITDIYIPVKNGGILTLLWAFYSITFFVYYLRKGNKTMVYAAFICIIIVAAKLIFTDLYTLSMVSKVITSIVFGIALLAVSYAIQPLLKQFTKTDKTEDKTS